MKKLLICAMVLCVSGFSAMGQKAKTTKPATKTAVKSPVIKTVMKNLNDSFSYAAGMNIATNMKNQGITEVNAELLAKAINDVFQGKVKAMTDDVAMGCLQSQMTTYAEKKQADAMKQAAAEAAKGKAFLDSNKNRKGVFALENGLQFEVITPGDSVGAKPTLSDTVVVSYAGRLIDGTEFDSSTKNGGPVTFLLTEVIRGWTEILQMMTKGAHWKVYIPSELAYGTRGAGGGMIPPGATLIFDMTLEDIKPAATK